MTEKHLWLSSHWLLVWITYWQVTKNRGRTDWQNISFVDCVGFRASTQPTVTIYNLGFHSIHFPNEWGGDWSKKIFYHKTRLSFHSIHFPNEWGVAWWYSRQDWLSRYVSTQYISPTSGEHGEPGYWIGLISRSGFHSIHFPNEWGVNLYQSTSISGDFLFPLNTFPQRVGSQFRILLRHTMWQKVVSTQYISPTSGESPKQNRGMAGAKL